MGCVLASGSQGSECFSILLQGLSPLSIENQGGTMTNCMAVVSSTLVPFQGRECCEGHRMGSIQGRVQRTGVRTHCPVQ